MNIRLFLQPIDGTCGDQLITLLSDQEFNRFYINVAFVKWSGLSRLWEALQSFKDRGGTLQASIGIDQQGTTIDAVRLLRNISDRLYIVYSTQSTTTYHPKLYVLEGDKKSVVIYGSSNLTAGGLWTNVEGFVIVEFDFPTDVDVYASVKRIINYLSDVTQPQVYLLDDNLMLSLERELPTEGAASFKPKKTALVEDPTNPHETRNVASFFGPGLRVNAPAPSQILPVTSDTIQTPRRVAHDIPVSTVSDTPVPLVPVTKYQGFWKMLSRNDTSATSSPGQIQIPIRFEGLFPTLKQSTVTTIALQFEATFPVIFRGVSGSQIVPNARFIKYVPAPHHPRPNVECRFTFLEPSINPAQLSEDDILLFQLVDASTGAYFEVTHIPVNTIEYAKFELTLKRFDFI